MKYADYSFDNYKYFKKCLLNLECNKEFRELYGNKIREVLHSLNGLAGIW